MLLATVPEIRQPEEPEVKAFHQSETVLIKLPRTCSWRFRSSEEAADRQGAFN